MSLKIDDNQIHTFPVVRMNKLFQIFWGYYLQKEVRKCD